MNTFNTNYTIQYIHTLNSTIGYINQNYNWTKGVDLAKLSLNFLTRLL